MVEAVSSSGAFNPYSEPPEEKQKNSEIQFETAVLGMFIAATEKNSNLNYQADNLKQGIKSGKSPSELFGDINHLIDQLNQNIKDRAPYPSFGFLENNPVQSLGNNIIKFQAYSNLVARQGGIDWNSQKTLYSQAMDLLARVQKGDFPIPQEGMQQLQGFIDEFNKKVFAEFQYPNIPDELLRY